MITPGTRLGNYIVDAPIAGGGMGVVYKGHHALLGQTVAIKVLLPNLAMKKRVRRRFAQEAWVQSQLASPGIVAVRDFVEQGDVLAIVMEFVVGPSLEHVLEIEQPGPWPVKQAMGVFGQVLSAVAYAHRRRVVHRDLKPANVLLHRPEGAPWPGIVKVTDFGLAKLLEDESGMTVAGSRMGTVPYMAAEQFAGKPDIGPQADVHALGMILWRMLTGRLPLHPDDMMAAVELYSGRQPIPRPSTLDIPIDGQIESTLAAALSSAPERRPASANELATGLGVTIATRTGGSQPSAAPHETAPPVPDIAEHGPRPQEVRELHDEGPDPLVDTTEITDRPPGRQSTARLALGLGTLLALGLAVMILNGDRKAAAEEARLAAERADQVAAVAQLLEHFKTDHAANSDDGTIASAVTMATAIGDTTPHSEALGWLQLATVWSHKWHYTGATFDEIAFRADDALTNNVDLQQSSGPGQLARALLLSNACTILGPYTSRGEPLCEQAIEHYQGFFKKETEGWLAFEGVWTYAMFLNRLAVHAWKDGDTANARDFWQVTLATCNESMKDLAVSPVNDNELLQECMVAAGGLRDHEAYVGFARRIWKDDLQDKNALRSSSVTRIFRSAAPDCVDVKMVRNQPSSSRNATLRHCTALGYIALGCEHAASVEMAYGSTTYNYDWNRLEAAWTPSSRGCYLD